MAVVDRGYDSDRLDDTLMTTYGIEMIAAQRRGRARSHLLPDLQLKERAAARLDDVLRQTEQTAVKTDVKSEEKLVSREGIATIKASPKGEAGHGSPEGIEHVRRGRRPKPTCR
jgi:hypothetical protein